MTQSENDPKTQSILQWIDTTEDITALSKIAAAASSRVTNLITALIRKPERVFSQHQTPVDLADLRKGALSFACHKEAKFYYMNGTQPCNHCYSPSEIHEFQYSASSQEELHKVTNAITDYIKELMPKVALPWETPYLKEIFWRCVSDLYEKKFATVEFKVSTPKTVKTISANIPSIDLFSICQEAFIPDPSNGCPTTHNPDLITSVDASEREALYQENIRHLWYHDIVSIKWNDQVIMSTSQPDIPYICFDEIGAYIGIYSAATYKDLVRKNPNVTFVCQPFQNWTTYEPDHLIRITPLSKS